MGETGSVSSPSRWPVAKGVPRPKILVVDDDPISRRVVASMLASIGDVLTAESAGEALAIVTDEVPNVVVTDIAMPDINGLELTRRLKSDPRTSRVPVVILTAKTAPADVIAGVNAGARFYVSKPVDGVELTTRVKKALIR